MAKSVKKPFKPDADPEIVPGDESQMQLFETGDVAREDALIQDSDNTDSGGLKPSDRAGQPVEEPQNPTDYPYFVLVDEEAAGPYLPSEIHEKLEAGELSPESYIWNQTLDEWLPLYRVFGLETQLDLEEAIEKHVEERAEALYPLAGFTRRSVAGCIDTILIALVFIASCILVPPFRTWIEVNSAITENWLRVNLVLLIPVYFYFLIFLGPWGKGQTPGNRWLGLQLVDRQTRQAPSWFQAQLWCLGNIVNFVGWIPYWFDPQRRMLHNMISRTIVLKLPS